MIKCTYDEDIFTLDAAKRRQLPAWIREGLEKMEKEKQKAVERERQEILRKQELEARKQAEDEARAVLNPCKSKFVGVQMHALIACFANKAMLNDPGKRSFISFLVTFLKRRILIPRRKLNKMLMMGYIISR